MVFRRQNDEDDDLEQQPSSDFARMLEESYDKTQKRLKQGDRVRGEVLSAGRGEFVVVSTGTPYDGLIPKIDFLDADGQLRVKTGDFVDVYVIQIRGTEILMSPNATAKNLADDVEDAFNRNLVVEGKIEELQNGGFRVSVFGKRAFCPVSQVDIKFVEKPEEYVGKRFEFHITQYSERGRNIVVSRRRVLEQQKAVAQTAFLQDKKPGDIVTGSVSRLEKFGAFIEIATGIDGLAHISEISWSRIGDPNEVLEVGQQVSAKILKVEQEDGRMKISLSLKQVQEQPWLNIPTELEAGRVLQGKVTRCLKFGAFVELFPGIEGLVPMSEMSYTKRVTTSDEFMKEGEKVLVKVKEVDAFTRRISLSLRDAEGGDPWMEVAEKFRVGSIVSGTMERREAYGLFIRLADGITGLLPKSKAHEQPEFGYDKLRPGDAVKVRIGEVKTAERRISLDVPSETGAEDWKTYSDEKAKTSSASSMGLLGKQLQAAMERKTKN